MTEALDLLGQPVMQRSAHFASPDERIVVSRRWSDGPTAIVIGHNPSVGDAYKDDPTIKWWIRWFQHYGFGGFRALNLYPFVTSDPVECRRKADWAATDDWSARDSLLFVNLPILVEEAKGARQLFACWGNIATDWDWVEHVVEEIQSGVAPYPDIWCWGKTKSGAPTHPMARGKHRIDPLAEPILWRAA